MRSLPKAIGLASINHIPTAPSTGGGPAIDAITGANHAGPLQSRRFLETLFATKADEHYVLLWDPRTKTSHWFQDVDGAIQFAAPFSAQDLYVGAGLSSQHYGPFHRCVSEQVAGIVGVCADLDLRSDAHPKQGLPATLEAALSILPPELPPSYVISSGNGAHAWWLFKECWVFEDHDDRKRAATLVSRWQSLLRFNAASRGWAFDRLPDLARLLRVPGTRNCKDSRNPKPVEIHTETQRRYNPRDVAEYLDAHGIPDPEEQGRATEAWKENFAGKPLVIDQSAVVPAELLNRLMADLRFKNTWLRERPDLTDSSQSGYDLALANCGCAAGLSEQQVLDLMIHHRRIHAQRPRTRIDYFQRTIAKAFQRGENARRSSASEGGVVAHGSSPVSGADTEETPLHAQPDSATRRAILCARISTVLGVTVLRIVKVTGKEPTYQMELDTAKVVFANVSKLIDQGSFRVVIAAGTDRLIPKVKPKLWEHIVQMMLDALTIADGGEDADLAGSMRIYLEQYLAETPFIDSIEQEPVQTGRKPAVVDGQITVSSTDLQQFINKTFGKNHPIAEITSMLTALGASSRRVKATRLRDQSRWFLPPGQFEPADYVAGQENPSAHGG